MKDSYHPQADFDEMHWRQRQNRLRDLRGDFYHQAKTPKTHQWHDLSKDIRSTYERLGVVAEPGDQYSGIQTQYDSEMVYGSVHQAVNRQEIIFTDTDNALRQYPELVRTNHC